MPQAHTFDWPIFSGVMRETSFLPGMILSSAL